MLKADPVCLACASEGNGHDLTPPRGACQPLAVPAACFACACTPSAAPTRTSALCACPRLVRQLLCSAQRALRALVDDGDSQVLALGRARDWPLVADSRSACSHALLGGIGHALAYIGPRRPYTYKKEPSLLEGCFRDTQECLRSHLHVHTFTPKRTRGEY